jgi:hypothetical protein
MFRFERQQPPAARLARLALAALWLIASVAMVPAFAQQGNAAALEELLQILARNRSLQASLIDELPAHLHGQLLAIAEFDDQQQQWMPMQAPQDFGVAGATRITILGRDAGDGGFVAARYQQFTDREVVSYTGLTADRRMSINLYDDAADREHLVLTIRIGPRQLKYLLLRPE